MKTFEITFTSNPESGIYSANLINAESAEQATAYFKSLGACEVVGCAETQSSPKPGQPIHTVPEGWEAPEDEEEEKAARTADVQEVRHGYWIEDKETGCLICSECGRFTDEIIGDMIEQDGKIIHRSMYPFYCSKCGADMKGETMNKSNNMQTKKVFSAAKYLISMLKICNDEEIQDIIIPSINPKGWVWDCDGKTPKECKDIGFGIVDEWCIEIPQNENIDFWRNYSN